MSNRDTARPNAASAVSCQGDAAPAPLATGRRGFGRSEMSEGKKEANEDVMTAAASDEEASTVASLRSK